MDVRKLTHPDVLSGNVCCLCFKDTPAEDKAWYSCDSDTNICGRNIHKKCIPRKPLSKYWYCDACSICMYCDHNVVTTDTQDDPYMSCPTCHLSAHTSCQKRINEACKYCLNGLLTVEPGDSAE